jgi:hypothetical protein
MRAPIGANGRPRASAAMLAAMGCISSVTPTAGARPMLIANTGLNYRVWLRDGLESRTLGAGVRLVPPTIVASCPRESNVRAFQGGIYGI